MVNINIVWNPIVISPYEKPRCWAGLADDLWVWLLELLYIKLFDEVFLGKIQTNRFKAFTVFSYEFIDNSLSLGEIVRYKKTTLDRIAMVNRNYIISLKILLSVHSYTAHNQAGRYPFTRKVNIFLFGLVHWYYLTYIIYKTQLENIFLPRKGL